MQVPSGQCRAACAVSGLMPPLANATSGPGAHFPTSCLRATGVINFPKVGRYTLGHPRLAEDPPWIARGTQVPRYLVSAGLWLDRTLVSRRGYSDDWSWAACQKRTLYTLWGSLTSACSLAMELTSTSASPCWAQALHPAVFLALRK